MRKLLITLALMVGSFSLASPAQDLFDQASFYLEFYYNGFSTVNVKDLGSRYQQKLEQTCASAGENCTYDQAVPLIESMIEEIGDGHTYYQSPVDLSRSDQSRQGEQPSKVLRVGLSHQAVSGSHDRLVMDVVEDSPASEAGILYGDRIVAVNGRLLESFSSDADAQKFLSEQVQSGNPVTFTIVRGTERQKLDIRMVPREINEVRLPSLRYLPGDVAVIHIPEFFPEGVVGERVHRLVSQAKEHGSKSMILDLRGNPGGSAMEALISMAAFMDNPTVIFTDRYSSQRTEYIIIGSKGSIRNAKGDTLTRFNLPFASRWTSPLAILVDEGSASGAEYLASALQQAGIGKVIGQPTFGIGNTTTRTFDLINGGGLNISFNRAFFAGGKPYPEQVKPDILSKLDLDILANQGRDVVIEQALQILKGQSMANTVAPLQPNALMFSAIN